MFSQGSDLAASSASGCVSVTDWPRFPALRVTGPVTSQALCVATSLGCPGMMSAPSTARQYRGTLSRPPCLNQPRYQGPGALSGKQREQRIPRVCPTFLVLGERKAGPAHSAHPLGEPTIGADLALVNSLRRPN